MPNIITHQQVYTAFVNTLKTITTANGYVRSLPSDHFYANYDQTVINKSKPATYPKVFVTTGDAIPTAQNNSRKRYDTVFYVTAVVLQSINVNDGGVTDDPQAQCRVIAEDVEKALVQNYTLGGVVTSVELSSVSFDAGFANPEGIVIFEIKVSYFKQY